ncbi:MAG TPA: AMP-binding protein [Solirubrobacterales bacterium]|nr:AMP-binding protein [Solirubrobacterales bacterium]
MAPAGPEDNPVLELVGAERLSVPALLAERARRSPERLFLRWQGERWSHAEAWEEALRFAAWARGPGGVAGPGARVAAFLPNRPEMLWAWLGTLAAGAVFVPLNRAHRGEILAEMIARSGARALVTDAAGRADLPDLSGTGIETVLLAEDWDEVRAREPAEPAAPAPGDLAELMYTSGTTGRSKAVRLSHGQLCRGAGWVAWSLAMGERDVFHAWMPLFHIAGQSDTVLPAVIAGAAVDLHPTFSRSRFWDQVRASGATLFIGFANVARFLCSLPPRPDDAATTLRAGVTGAMPAELAVGFERRFGVPLHDVYGMTEGEPMALPHPGEATPPGSCGRPRPDLELAILGEDGEPLGPGEVGEIAVRGRTDAVLSDGYEGDPEATAAANRGGWFHTGDLGRRDEAGFVFFADRLVHSIRHRGENISSWELESLLASAPGVAEACAVGVPSPLGEEDVKAVVVPAEGAGVDPAELWQWCRGRMAAFMVPRYIEVAASLPRADTGKVMKEQLRGLGPDVWDAEVGSGG